MFNFPFWKSPYSNYYHYYSLYNNDNNINNSTFIDNKNNKSNNNEQNNRSSKNKFSSPINFNFGFSSNSDPIIEFMGLTLYLDDLIIIGILFFLYDEDVNDELLFIILILLLLS